MTTRSKQFGFTITQKIRQVATRIVETDDPMKIAKLSSKIAKLLQMYHKMADRRRVSR